MNFIKRLNRENFIFKLEFSNFMSNWLYESYRKIQNFSSISLKYCLLGQKNTGTWGVSITIDNTIIKVILVGIQDIVLILVIF